MIELTDQQLHELENPQAVPVRIVNPRASYELPSFEGGAWTQVSRLSAPLVNEVVIGLKDKDRFNASEPKDDAQFANYVTNPSLPELIEVLFGIPGMGRLGWASIEQKDFPTLMALVYIEAILVLLSILLSDLLYVVVDPRISFEGRGRKK